MAHAVVKKGSTTPWKNKNVKKQSRKRERKKFEVKVVVKSFFSYFKFRRFVQDWSIFFVEQSWESIILVESTILPVGVFFDHFCVEEICRVSFLYWLFEVFFIESIIWSSRPFHRSMFFRSFFCRTNSWNFVFSIVVYFIFVDVVLGENYFVKKTLITNTDCTNYILV